MFDLPLMTAAAVALAAMAFAVPVRAAGPVPAALAASGSGGTPSNRVASEGEYVDCGGGRHLWRVTTGHTLLWDGTPFLPAGGLFRAQSWSHDATDADFAADCAALATLKAHGVTDLIVQPARGGITTVASASIQRLLDVLEANGFTYGISLNDGPRDVLAAYEIRPGAYRQAFSDDGAALRFPIGDVLSALYFAVKQDGSEMVSSGEAESTADGVRVPALPDAVNGVPVIAFLVPERAYSPDSDLGLPNLWDGYDTYRDALLALFGRLHLGKGLRFFVDPLQPTLSLSDDARRMIPDSPGFSTEWATFLSTRYRTIDALYDAWKLTDRDVPDFATAATLLPLWNGGKGIGSFYSTATKQRYVTNQTESEFWSDLRLFQEASIRGSMADLATALKRGVADVPVVYRSGGWSSLLTHLPSSDPGCGIDGVGIVSYGSASDLVESGAGAVYAEASSVPRTLWLPVVATDPKTGDSFDSRSSLDAAFDQLWAIGGRGFYLDNLPAGGGAAVDPLDWLSDYRTALMKAATDSSATNVVPAVVSFPLGMDGPRIRMLASGNWWLPTDRPASTYDFGPTIRAYGLTDPDGGSTYYLWDPAGGTRTVHIPLPPQSKLKNAPLVQWAPIGAGDVKHGVLTLTLGPDPVQLLNFPTVPLPSDAFDAAYKEGERLAQEMERRKILEAGRSLIDLPAIRHQYDMGDRLDSYAELQTNIVQMRARLRDYAWLEAEGTDDDPVQQSFDAIEDRAGASGGRVLVVGRRAAGMPLAAATYNITVGQAGSYQLWVAASPGAPLTFDLDGASLLDEGNIIGHVPDVPGATYSSGSLVWTHMGTVSLPQGAHKLEMRATGPTVVDVILLYKGEFAPEGIAPPPVIPEQP